MLNRLVELSLRYKFLVLIVFAVVAFLRVGRDSCKKQPNGP